jgi:hypothetical protein
LSSNRFRRDLLGTRRLLFQESIAIGMEARSPRGSNPFEDKVVRFNLGGPCSAWFSFRPVTLDPRQPGDGKNIGYRVKCEAAFGVGAVEDDKRLLWHRCSSPEEEQGEASGHETDEAGV